MCSFQASTRAIAMAVSLAGCNPFAPKCKEHRVVVEEVFADPSPLDSDFYRKLGYTCASDGAIRNAFGARIGYRYVCTVCR